MSYHIRIRDESSGKTMYLYPTQAEADALAIQLGRGHLERFKAVEHASGNGWFVKDRESGRLYDAQGVIQ